MTLRAIAVVLALVLAPLCALAGWWGGHRRLAELDEVDEGRDPIYAAAEHGGPAAAVVCVCVAGALVLASVKR